MSTAKKDIDKNLMFQKIMPSANISTKTTSANPTSVVDTPLVAKQLDTKQFDSQPMINRAITIPQKNQSYITNLNEKAVSDNLDSVLERFKCCKCDRCKKDIIALSLNSLPPRYVVNCTNDTLSDFIDPQKTTEITTSIVRAVIKVKSEPRH